MVNYYVINVQTGRVYGVFRDKRIAKRLYRKLIKKSAPVIIEVKKR